MSEGRAVGIDPLAFNENTRAVHHMPGDDWALFVWQATTRALRQYRPEVNIEFWREWGLEAANNHADTGITSLYIDDGHHYAELLLNLECWYPRMKPGGLIFGHDFWANCPGVIEAVNEFFGTRNLAFETIPMTRLWFHRVPAI
jgi:hypothetical protein